MTRVVVTGMGAVTPVGVSLPETWEALVAGRSGIEPISLFDASEHEVRFAGEVRGFDPSSSMTAKEARRTDRFVHFAVAAADEAVRQAGLEGRAATEAGVIVGTGIGGIWTYTQDLEVVRERGLRAVSPFLVPAITVDAASVQVAMRLGARGPVLGVATACATGVDSIGLAAEAIRRGDAPVMVAGGTDAAVTPIAVAAFSRMRALSRRNDEPHRASRPFDRDRDGFVLAEGAAVLVLEAEGHARARGAEPLAEVAGYSATSDAAHLTSPEESGAMAAVCMRRAMARAGVAPVQVSLISAHATATPAGDPVEARAIRAALGERGERVPVTALKSLVGHLLGGAGALAAAAGIMSLRSGVIPPTANLDAPDPACSLDVVRGAARETPLDVVLCNAFGFGGHNATLVLRRLP
jgi:3-oxoacyl-[acyl-carrier-protein] synthase II